WSPQRSGKPTDAARSGHHHGGLSQSVVRFTISGHARGGHRAMVTRRYPLPVPHESFRLWKASQMPQSFPDLTCPICSKPVQGGGFVQSKDGEFVHLRCQSRDIQIRAIEQVDRAKATEHRAIRLVDAAAARLRARRQPRCPLCAYPTTLTDWQQEGFSWIVV